MRRSLVVAMARNRVIGRDNALPWRLPADLAHFRKVTMGHPVVMGRNNRDYRAPGCTVVPSLDAAWRAAEGAEEVCIIGGTSLFRESLPIADVIHLTEVEADVEGDTYFPDFDRSEWTETQIARQAVDERHAYPLRILRLERKSPGAARR